METLIDKLLTPENVYLILSGIGTWIGWLLRQANAELKRRTGLELTAAQMDVIHSAAMTGVSRALGMGQTREQAVQAGIDHMLGAGAGDSVRERGLSVDALRTIAEGKVGQVLGTIGR